VVELLNRGGPFPDVKDLAAGVRGRRVFDDGELDAGIWTVGTSMALINDIPTAAEVVSRIVDESEELITERLANLIEPSAQEKIPA
jgi:NADH:quinone reductase (non-electrogenic)